MKVGVIVDDITLHRWETEEIVKELKNRNIKFEIINIYSSPLDIVKRDWGIDVALARTSSATHFRLEAIKTLELDGVKVINSYDAIRRGGDKYVSLSILHHAGIPIPQTSMVASFESTVRAISKMGTPVVLKPVIGTYGRGIVRINDLERELEVLDNLQYPYLVQKYIPHKKGDFRVFVIKDEALGVIRRVAPKDEWRTNISAGGTSHKARLTSELAKIAVKASQKIGTQYAGVDIIEYNRKYYLIEINTQPDFRSFYASTGINPVKKIVDLVEEAG